MGYLSRHHHNHHLSIFSASRGFLSKPVCSILPKAVGLAGTRDGLRAKRAAYLALTLVPSSRSLACKKPTQSSSQISWILSSLTFLGWGWRTDDKGMFPLPSGSRVFGLSAESFHARAAAGATCEANIGPSPKRKRLHISHNAFCELRSTCQ